MTFFSPHSATELKEIVDISSQFPSFKPSKYKDKLMPGILNRDTVMSCLEGSMDTVSIKIFQNWKTFSQHFYIGLSVCLFYLQTAPVTMWIEYSGEKIKH